MGNVQYNVFLYKTFKTLRLSMVLFDTFHDLLRMYMDFARWCQRTLFLHTSLASLCTLLVLYVNDYAAL